MKKRRIQKKQDIVFLGSQYGPRLYHIRTEKNCSAKELARMLNLSEDAILVFERGFGCFTYKGYKKIAKYLGVSLEYLTDQKGWLAELFSNFYLLIKRKKRGSQI